MSQPYRADARPASGTRFALRAVWVVFTLSALAFVYNFGSNAPYADEWEFVPALVAEEAGLPWLWAQHNEHRLPLSRAIYLVLFRLSGDFRTGMYVQVVVLSALALVLMNYAARLRGGPDWPDAFFPVSLLHLGHWENFLMGYQLGFVLYTVLMTALVVVALQATGASAGRTGLKAGALLLLLVLSGGAGLAVAPPVAAWVLYLAGRAWRTGARGTAVAAAALALLSLLYFVPYFTDYQPPPHHPPRSYDPVAIGVVAAEAVAMAFGPGVSEVWGAVFLAQVVLVAVTARLVYRPSGEDRPSALGLAALLAGLGLLVVAIGHGRAAIGLKMGLYSRYALLTWPLVGGLYLLAARAGRKKLTAGICLLAVLAFLPNMGTGMITGNTVREHYQKMWADTLKGMTATELVQTHFPNSPNQFQEERAIRGIPLLKSAGVGIFAGK